MTFLISTTLPLSFTLYEVNYSCHGMKCITSVLNFEKQSKYVNQQVLFLKNERKEWNNIQKVLSNKCKFLLDKNGSKSYILKYYQIGLKIISAWKWTNQNNEFSFNYFWTVFSLVFYSLGWKLGKKIQAFLHPLQ